MMKAVEAFYVEGKPRHISCPNTSVFKIITQDVFENMSDNEVQEAIRHQHLIVTERKKPKYKFDPNGLETLTTLNNPIIIHGKLTYASIIHKNSHSF